MQGGTEILNPMWMRSKNHVPPCLVEDTSFQGRPRFRDMQTHSRVAAEWRGCRLQACPLVRLTPLLHVPRDGRGCPGRLWGRGSVARP